MRQMVAACGLKIVDFHLKSVPFDPFYIRSTMRVEGRRAVQVTKNARYLDRDLAQLVVGIFCGFESNTIKMLFDC